MYRWCLALTVAAGWASSALAYLDYPAAKSLPEMDVNCYRSYAINFSDDTRGQNIQGSGDSRIRHNIYTAHKLTLNIREDPEGKSFNKFWGRSAGDLSIGKGVDTEKPDIFIWSQGTTEGNNYFSYNVSDKTLSIVRLRTKGSVLLIGMHENEVLKCKDK
jgi:hypothetical protein